MKKNITRPRIMLKALEPTTLRWFADERIAEAKRIEDALNTDPLIRYRAVDLRADAKRLRSLATRAERYRDQHKLPAPSWSD